MQRVLILFSIVLFALVLTSANAFWNAHPPKLNVAEEVPQDSDLTSEVLAQWQTFKQKFKKRYPSIEEENKRFDIFVQNLKEFETRKSTFSPSMQVGVTKFFDLTREEWKQRFHTLGPARPSRSHADLTYMKDYPQVWDWTQKGAVTPVKNEEQCGATWAMAAIDTLESVCKIAGYPLTVLSTQQVLDCDTKGDDEGCNGGFPAGAYQYILSAGGIESNKSYPYQAQNQNCMVNPKDFVPCHMKSYTNVTAGANEEGMMKFVYTQSPVVVCIEAGQNAFEYYTGGVITGKDCSSQYIDHCIVLVGWDFINGKRVWKLKNQWGTDWGDKGYVYFEIGTNTCGMDSPYSVAACVNDTC